MTGGGDPADDPTAWEALASRLRAVVAEMSHLAGQIPPTDPVPAFELEVDERRMVARILDDNGGGEETSHETVEELRIERDGGRAPRLVAGAWADDGHGGTASVDGIVAAVRGACERALGLINADNSPQTVFRCPFCDRVAGDAPPGRTLCAARRCGCGAVGLSAPAVDTDEIIDDAIGLFDVGVRDASRGHDAALLEDVRRAGIEVREGWSGGSGLHPWGPQRTLWFRRRGQDA